LSSDSIVYALSGVILIILSVIFIVIAVIRAVKKRGLQ